MNWKKWKNRWIWQDAEKRKRNFGSVEELETCWTDEAVLESIYWFGRRICRSIKELPRDINLFVRTKYQRAKRGWAVSDTWGFDWYLARVIAEGCKWLQKHKHGCPNIDGFNSETDAGFEAMCAEWDRILGEIIWTFETAQNIIDRNWLYVTDETDRPREEKMFANLTKNGNKYGYYLMTVDDCARYKRGWTYFQEYFFSLWD